MHSRNAFHLCATGRLYLPARHPRLNGNSGQSSTLARLVGNFGQSSTLARLFRGVRSGGAQSLCADNSAGAALAS
eukprot:7832846-Pyramimonas_sp.AAC.2